MKRWLLGLALLLMLPVSQMLIGQVQWAKLSAAERVADVRERRETMVREELKDKGLKLGCHAFIRVFKEELELELWLKPVNQTKWVKFKTWPIAAMSGKLGPKEREGDLQAPEGCYHLTAKQMNPLSRYHLSFNVGYPNTLDLAHGRTGSLIMVHGSDVSIGCFAMTDAVIEDIYLVLLEAFQAGQASVAVHCFPFRMSAERMQAAKDHQWQSFWQELLPIYQSFERTHKPPRVTLKEGNQHYQCNDVRY
jgi:murein L,D-transpeptidase YafK